MARFKCNSQNKHKNEPLIEPHENSWGTMLSVELHIFLYSSLSVAESGVVDGGLMSCDKALVIK